MRATHTKYNVIKIESGSLDIATSFYDIVIIDRRKFVR